MFASLRYFARSYFGGIWPSVSGLVIPADLIVGAPAFGNPALTPSVIALQAGSLAVSAASLGSPTATSEAPEGLVAASLIVAAPVLSAPAVVVRITFTADALQVGAPQVGASSLTTVLWSANVVVGGPTLGAPDSVAHAALIASDLVVGVPSLGTPTFPELYALTTEDLVAGAPGLGQPTLQIVTEFPAELVELDGSIGPTPIVVGTDSDLEDVDGVPPLQPELPGIPLPVGWIGGWPPAWVVAGSASTEQAITGAPNSQAAVVGQDMDDA